MLTCLNWNLKNCVVLELFQEFLLSKTTCLFCIEAWTQLNKSSQTCLAIPLRLFLLRFSLCSKSAISSHLLSRPNSRLRIILSKRMNGMTWQWHCNFQNTNPIKMNEEKQWGREGHPGYKFILKTNKNDIATFKRHYFVEVIKFKLIWIELNWLSVAVQVYDLYDLATFKMPNFV